MRFLVKESLNCFEKESPWKPQTAENLLPMWRYLVLIFRGSAFTRVAVSRLFYCGSCIRSKKQDEMIPQDSQQCYEMLENCTQFSSGRKARLPESLLYETPARTEILCKRSVPERCRLFLERNTPTKGVQQGMGWSRRQGHTLCRPAVKYKSQAIWFGLGFRYKGSGPFQSTLLL